MTKTETIEDETATDATSFDLPADEEISSAVGEHVEAGFASREGIISFCAGELARPYTEAVEARVAKITDELLAKHKAAQASWPADTDCDRLGGAFGAMEERGILALANFSCCVKNGLTEIDAAVEQKKAKDRAIGYVFFSREDTATAIRAGILQLTFDSLKPRVVSATAIGRMIRDALVESGFTVDWNGTARGRMRIVGIDWKNRGTATEAKRKVTKAE